MSSDRVRLFKQQISQLEDELERLRSKIDRRRHISVSLKTLSQIKASRDNEAAASCTSVANLDKDPILIKLNEQLDALKALTGIELKEVTGHPLGESADDSCNEMHYSVRGSSSGLVFELHFNIRQTENEVRISNIQIDSTEEINNELGHLFDSIETEQSIQSFPLVFVPYGKLRSERRRTFSYIQETFGSVIQLPEGVAGSKLEFCHKLDEKIIFHLTWNFIVSSRDSMSHRIRLDVDAPPPALENIVLKNAPEMLDAMICSLGPQAAIEAFISSSALNQNDVPLCKDTT